MGLNYSKRKSEAHVDGMAYVAPTLEHVELAAALTVAHFHMDDDEACRELLETLGLDKVRS